MINIIVSSDPKYPVNKLAIQSTVLEVLQRYHVRERVEIGIKIIGDKKMHSINKKYRGIDSTTNIITFALEDLTSENLQYLPRTGFVHPPDKILRLGDILLSHPQVEEDARFDGISVEEEMRQLIEHGVKHLLGLHHE